MKISEKKVDDSRRIKNSNKVSFSVLQKRNFENYERRNKLNNKSSFRNRPEERPGFKKP